MILTSVDQVMRNIDTKSTVAWNGAEFGECVLALGALGGGGKESFPGVVTHLEDGGDTSPYPHPQVS